VARFHFNALGRRVVAFLDSAGELGLFSARIIRDALRRPFEVHEIGRQIAEIGSRSVPLIIACGVALGIVMSLHTRASLARFGASSMIPAALTIATFRELGPILRDQPNTLIDFKGRGTAITADYQVARYDPSADKVTISDNVYSGHCGAGSCFLHEDVITWKSLLPVMLAEPSSCR